MRPVRIGRFELNHDANPTGLEDATTLTGAVAEEMRRHLDAYGVRPWRPARPMAASGHQLMFDRIAILSRSSRAE
jgi:hypothetical protein